MIDSLIQEERGIKNQCEPMGQCEVAVGVCRKQVWSNGEDGRPRICSRSGLWVQVPSLAFLLGGGITSNYQIALLKGLLPSLPYGACLKIRPKREGWDGCLPCNLNPSDNNFNFIGPMKHCLLLMLLLLISSVSGQCPSFHTQQCTFEFTGDDCSFGSCSIHHEGSTETQSTLYSWENCLASCCNKAEPSAERFLSSLKRVCPGGQPQEEEIMSLLGFGLGVGLVLLLIVYFYCYGLDKLKRILFGKSTQQSMELSTIQFNNLIKEPINQAHIIKFLTTEEAVEQRPGRTCSICLQERTDVRASCGHEFHAPCITEWYKRKQDCPECRQKSGKALHTLFCSCCRRENLVRTLSAGDIACSSCS